MDKRTAIYKVLFKNSALASVILGIAFIVSCAIGGHSLLLENIQIVLASFLVLSWVAIVVFYVVLVMKDYKEGDGNHGQVN